MKRGILFFILLSVLSASEPAFAKDPALIRSGYKYIDKGFISKAIPTFQQAVEKYPDNYKAHLGLAIATFKQGGNENFKIAKDHFRRALDLQSDNYEAMTKLARLLSWDPNSRSEALHLYRRASAIKPNDMDIKYQLAEVLSWEGNSYESVDLLEQLYKNKPNDNKLALLYANALSGSGRHFDSLGLYKKAIQGKVVFDKNSALNYARALAKTYNTDMAIKIYNDYLNLADEQNEILNAKKELASVLFDSGRYNEAIDIDSTIENKTKDVLLRLARANDKVANTQEAIAIFEETYNIYPDDLEVQRSAAQFLSKIGGYNITASKIFERMIQNGTATLDDKISLAYIYNEKDATKDKAIELFR
ncbi:MAG: tetratricopeptide repeat protein, partial [Cyanobacteriota bacterium]